MARDCPTILSPEVNNAKLAMGLVQTREALGLGQGDLFTSAEPEIEYHIVRIEQRPGETRLPIIAYPQLAGHPVQPVPRNRRWGRSSQTSRLYEALVAVYPTWLGFDIMSNIARGGVSRRMRGIRIWLQGEGWDYDNKNHWYHGERLSYYRVYDLQNDYGRPTA